MREYYLDQLGKYHTSFYIEYLLKYILQTKSNLKSDLNEECFGITIFE